jgi:hypothetical protein
MWTWQKRLVLGVAVAGRVWTILQGPTRSSVRRFGFAMRSWRETGLGVDEPKCAPQPIGSAVAERVGGTCQLDRAAPALAEACSRLAHPPRASTLDTTRHDRPSTDHEAMMPV